MSSEYLGFNIFLILLAFLAALAANNRGYILPGFKNSCRVERLFEPPVQCHQRRR